MQRIAPGVWKIRFGAPEPHTPLALKEEPPMLDAMAALPPADAPHLKATDITFQLTARGCVVKIPFAEGEQFFGCGLQLKSVNHTRRKKMLRTNSDPVSDTGDSHAPVPFVLSTAGYGIFIDTLRYATIYCGAHVDRTQAAQAASAQPAATAAIATNTADLYSTARLSGKSIVIEIPTARGVDILLFAGPTLKDAAQRYNLFSGGGCLPPMWGLGVWYRCHGQFNADKAVALAQSFRERHIPCDVLGLEPGWQTRGYSCSFVWDSGRFPDVPGFTQTVQSLGYKLNLWEHVFTHPTSPLYAPLADHSGDYEVWGGLVPDFTLAAARSAFADYHDREFVSQGVSGFKLDECDHSDFVGAWSFPEHSRFPSGLDGEQMHSALGILYQRTIGSIFRKHNRRTYSAVRASHAFAAPQPFVLYSDLYDHKDFVRGVVNIGFTGLLWTPEVRHSKSPEELYRRIQSVILSPQALVNAWYIANPPWLQVDTDKNNANQLLDNRDEVEAVCRDLFRLRMRLLPMLYAAFARYHFEGLPPFRALVMDWPQDEGAHKIDNEWLVGEGLLVAPMFDGQTRRDVYLPPGEWFDFHTGQPYPGGQTHSIEADTKTIPLFVKSGTILPLAEPVEFVAPDTVFDITVHTFGRDCRPTSLFEDDGETFDYEKGRYNWIELSWTPATGEKVTRHGNYQPQRYRITGWKHIGA